MDQPKVSDDGKFFWDGAAWKPMPSETPPAPPAKLRVEVAEWVKFLVGFLVVAAIAGVIWLITSSGPSDLDCALQRAEVATGERAYVDDGCEE